MTTFLARVRRTPIPGGDASDVLVSLELVRDTDTVELSDGAEFVTVELTVDPFAPPAPPG